MKYWMTQSLLSSWIYYLDADEEYSDAAWESFLCTLRREKKEPTKAMEDGTRFEALVNGLVAGVPVQPHNDIWYQAAERFARMCSGGQAQTPVTGELNIGGMDFVLYGVCDYVKAGIIYDIKKVTRYEYGKYLHSPQHPMYLHLVPEAKKFEYLIFDGNNCYKEVYRREDCKSIEQTIYEFIGFLRDADLLGVYMEHWAMNSEREEKRSVPI